jgi:hypothetical protein
MPKPSPPIPLSYVLARLESAGLVLICLPERERIRRLEGPLRGTIAPFLTDRVRRDQTEALSKLTPEHVAKADEAFGWINLIPADQLTARRIVSARSLILPTERYLFPWRRVANLVNLTQDAAKYQHSVGLTIITMKLNAKIGEENAISGR